MVKQCYYQNVKYGVTKNKNIQKKKKKRKEINGLLSSLRIKTPLSKIPLLGNVLF